MRRFSQAQGGLLVCIAMATAAGSATPVQDNADADPRPPAKAAEEAAKPEAEATGRSWPVGLKEGYRRALADGKPVLLRAGSSTCPQCRLLAAEIADPTVQAELERWTLVYLDMARPTDEAAGLNIELLPALRILTARGRLVASHDGLLTAGELVAWLEAQRQKFQAPPDDALLGSGPPDAVEVVRLVRQFGNRSPAIRETAIRRLLPYPQSAAVAVAKAFRDGNLSARLAALELLGEWKAPVDQIDPWRLATVTQKRMAALEEWAGQVGAPPPGFLEEITEDQLAAARRSIDRMLKSPPAEADAIRERLARLGPALLPEVYARLAEATTDRQHRLLLTLRYRLVSSDSLVLRWPEGLVRLAAADSKQRQAAAEELTRLAGREDQRLLLELFNDPDPLVREISLRGLQQIGGPEATAALVELLKDPEPNVRAAVLKQLAENPSRKMVPPVAEYLTEEADPDLIVHAIRFLRAAGGPTAIKSLMTLLKHESWQVRAEAAEAIGNSSSLDSFGFSSYGPGGFNDEPDELTVDAYVALIELLDDPDAFVVSRAVEGLSNADMVVAVEPLVKAAEKHPKLASTIAAMLARGQKMRAKATPYLRDFCKHPDPLVRAAAVASLCQATEGAAENEILAALEDPESSVRIATATALFELAEARRNRTESELLNGFGSSLSMDPFAPEVHVVPSTALISRAARLAARLFGGSRTADTQAPDDQPDQPTPEETAPVPQASEKSQSPADEGQPDPDRQSPWDVWLRKHYAKRGHFAWADRAIPLLEKMLAAEAVEERLAAALVLVPLGRGEAALPVIIEVARSKPALVVRAGRVLPWLLFEERLDTFNELRSVVAGQQDLAAIISTMAMIPDRRAAGLFWDLLADEALSADAVRALQMGLHRAYVGREYMAASKMRPSVREVLTREAMARASSGSAWQRLTAVRLLAFADPDQAGEVADRLADDPNVKHSVRLDAFRIALATKPQAKAVDQAIAALSAEDERRRALALTYLAEGAGGSNRDTWLLGFDLPTTSWSNASTGRPIIPVPPPRLQAEHVRPLVDSPDKKTAAYAGYLLALFGDPRGLEKLIAYWRASGDDDGRTERLVYRAIASLDDSAYVPVLEEIYRGLERYAASEFYWTIRIMSGSEILRLRAKIRAEVGMEYLR